MSARTTLLATAAALASLGSFAGCLSVPDGPAPMCEVSTDCDQSHGEVCEEGVCWGNPPPGPFAAVIAPPSTRHDLVPREIPQIAIPKDGWMGDLALEAPVSLNGRIVEFCPPPMTGCASTTLGATVTVSRRSQFHGGPGFKAVVNVESGADSFAIPVPRTRVGDDPYTVTIVPDGGRQAGTERTPAELVPPLRMSVSTAANTSATTIELGGLDLPVISGTLTNALGQGLLGYRVTAFGRWDPSAAPTEVSSVDFTDTNGSYAVILSDALVGNVELVARPPSGTVAPTVHITGIDSRKSSQRNLAAPATLGAPIKVVVGPITGVDRGGMISPVRGALVSVAGALISTSSSSFTVGDEHLTDENGKVTLNLVDGGGLLGSYRLAIIPPASSSLSAVFDQKLVPATELRLGPRVALHGTIVDSDHKPLNNVAVTARPSLRFLWSLDTVPQAFLAAIPPSTAVTLETGDFVVWVDAAVAQVWGNYDLSIEPPATAQAPTYVKAGVDARSGGGDAVQVGEIALPDAAFVHGRITGPDGDSVENAELKLYLVSTELLLCDQVAHPPSSCPIPALLEGRNTSDAKGTVRLALPR
jgi:hypothetical protein